MTIELEPDEIRRELDRSYNELKRSVQLKGFRPGKAPRQILERFFGDQVRGEVIQKLIKESTEKALAEHELKPLVEPEIVTEETDLSKMLRFSATFDVRPELVVKDYVGLKVPKSLAEVSESEIDSALQRLREQMASLKKVEGREVVQAGDVVLAELEGFEGDQPIAGTKLEARTLEVTDKTLAHGLHELLIGAEVGKLKTMRKSYPPDYEEKEIAGKDVEWRATVKEIFQKQLPELDDEFAKDQGEFQTLGELREKVREDLIARAKREADGRVRQGLLDMVLERNPVEVPESLVDRELRSLEAQAAFINQARGMNREEAVERARSSRDELKGQAERRARSQLILDAIADQEKIEVTDDEVAEQVARLVQQERDRETAANYYAKEEHREALKQSMQREKTLEHLISRAQQEQQEEALGESASES